MSQVAAAIHDHLGDLRQPQSPLDLYVRTRLKLEHGKPICPYSCWIAHCAAFFMLTILAIAHAILAVVPGAFALLLVRALVGLSNLSKTTPGKTDRVLEFAYGFFVVTLTALGYAMKR
jgi:hypothetical protein